MMKTRGITTIEQNKAMKDANEKLYFICQMNVSQEVRTKLVNEVQENLNTILKGGEINE